MRTLRTLPSVIALSLLTFALRAHAEDGLLNPLTAPDLETLLGQVLDFAINLGAMILVVMLVYVGFQFVVAQGSEERLTKARSALMWTLIGGLLLLGAKAIQLVVVSTVQGLTS